MRHAWVTCAYRILVGKTKGNTPLGRPRRRLQDNIKTDLREIVFLGCGLHLLKAGYRTKPHSCEYGNKILGSTKCAEFLDDMRNYQLVEDCTPLSFLASSSGLSVRTEHTVRTRFVQKSWVGPTVVGQYDVRRSHFAHPWQIDKIQ